MSVTIRAAQRGDAPLVLQFIRELADYEKLSDKVEATVPLLDAALFGEPPRAFCDLAESQGEPAGFALWFPTFTSFKCRPAIWLEDIFVREAYRRRGVAKALLAHLARRCRTQGFAQIEWAVLDWNEPAIRFYKAHGADFAPQWRMCSLSGAPLAQLAGTE